MFGAEEVRAALHPNDVHLAPTTLLAVENTHNSAGGRVFPVALLAEATSAAREAGLALHLDGARLWNAAIALGYTARRARGALRHRLGLPLEGARRAGRLAGRRHAGVRGPARAASARCYGGGMRQAGVLAAAGLFAVDHHVARLAEDHANARRLARGLGELGFAVEGEPETNIVMFRVADELAFQRAARERGVLSSRGGPGRLRAVTHLDVSSADIDEALDRLKPLAPAH